MSVRKIGYRPRNEETFSVFSFVEESSQPIVKNNSDRDPTATNNFPQHHSQKTQPSLLPQNNPQLAIESSSLGQTKATPNKNAIKIPIVDDKKITSPSSNQIVRSNFATGRIVPKISHKPIARLTIPKNIEPTNPVTDEKPTPLVNDGSSIGLTISSPPSADWTKTLVTEEDKNEKVDDGLQNDSGELIGPPVETTLSKFSVKAKSAKNKGHLGKNVGVEQLCQLLPDGFSIAKDKNGYLFDGTSIVILCKRHHMHFYQVELLYQKRFSCPTCKAGTKRVKKMREFIEDKLQQPFIFCPDGSGVGPILEKNLANKSPSVSGEYVFRNLRTKTRLIFVNEKSVLRKIQGDFTDLIIGSGVATLLVDELLNGKDVVTKNQIFQYSLDDTLNEFEFSGYRSNVVRTNSPKMLLENC